MSFFNMKAYSKTGPASWSKILVDTYTPDSANGYSIDVSAAGFSAVLGYQVVAIKNTATIDGIPFVSVKTVSNQAIVVNILDPNANLLGLTEGMEFADITGLTLSVVVFGN